MRTVKVHSVYNVGKNNHSKAMTLAEVLITLGIIGIVAAFTIPTLMHDTQEKEFKTGYKKAFSVLSQALQKANNDQALTPFLGNNDASDLEYNFAVLKQYFNVSKECPRLHLSECWDTSSNSDSYRMEDSSDVPSFIDNSGMQWRARAISYGGAAPTILVDINGNKKPNRYGQDRFPFYFSNTGNAVSGSYNIIGSPTKIIPMTDQINNGSQMCPSYATHLCYYTSWLYN